MSKNTEAAIVEELRRKNPDIPINSVFDAEFKDYGRLIHADDSAAVKELLDAAIKHCDMEKPGVSYTPGFPELKKLSAAVWAERELFGGMPIELGCCWGTNQQMNGMEYHKSSEVLGSCTDVLLLLGQRSEITPEGWDSSNVKAFYVPKGNLVEVYSTTLHFAPVSTDGKPFCAVIILPDMTNHPLKASGEERPTSHNLSAETDQDADNRYLYMINKWLLAHPESKAAQNGAPVGITGPNIEILPVE